jgi:aspartyl protease family protein
MIAAIVISTYGGDFISAMNSIEQKSALVDRKVKVNHNQNIVHSLQIPMQQNGQYWVDMNVNGRSITFLVDTGASFVALSDADAKSLGLYISETDYTMIVNTAAGQTTMAEVELDTMTIEAIELYNVKAYVARQGMLSVSLLGMNYLNRLESFKFQDKVLVLEQ